MSGNQFADSVDVKAHSIPAGRDALADVGVAGDVIRIVEIDEIIGSDRQVGEQNRKGKSGVNPQIEWRSEGASGRQAAKIIMTQAVLT